MPATTLTKLVAEAAALTCCVAFGCGAPGGPSDVLPLAEAMRGVAAEAQANATLPPPPATSAPGPTTITISAIGDCAIGDLHYGAGAPGSFLAKLEQVESPLDYPFSGVAQLFAEDDLTIANLEGTFTEREAWHNPVFSIRGKPSYAQMLRRGGVELVDVDNNHSHDYGPGGHDDTKRALDAAGVALVGGVLGLELLWELGVEQRGHGGLELAFDGFEVVDVDGFEPGVVEVVEWLKAVAGDRDLLC